MTSLRLILGSKMRTVDLEPKPQPAVTELIEEYVTPNGHTISLSHDGLDRWEVDCWNPDQSNHWNKVYRNLHYARLEFERWRT